MDIRAVSRIGFGCYRVSMSDTHRDALTHALLSCKISLIDTSANYMDGESEECVGHVVSNLVKSGKIERQNVYIISKFGYIQGQNLKRHNSGHVFPETTGCSHGLKHCIHADFMCDQLTRSLSRLQIEYIDMYMLHNPEYYLMQQVDEVLKHPHTHGTTHTHTFTHNHTHTHTNTDVHIHTQILQIRRTMLDRIARVFEALEREIHVFKRIKAYGISSNSFSLDDLNPYFLPYEDLISLSENACKSVLGDEYTEGVCGFKGIQLPANLVETHALTHAVTWAHTHKINVFINRPLNAIDLEHDHMWRLADADSRTAVKEFEITCNLISTLFSKYPQTCECLKKLCAKIEKFDSIFEWPQFCHTQVTQPLQDCIATEHLEEPQVAIINNFVEKAAQNVKYNSSMRARKDMNCKYGHKIRPNDSLQEFALNFLLNAPGVTCVLLGCRTREYVDNAIEILNKNC